MKKQVSGITIEITKGNIANQPDITAIVNAANAQLRMGGGVAGAIHRVAGPGLEEECRAFAPIRPGQAVLTSGHNLPNKYVVHCLGPVYGVDKPEEELLSDCYRNALSIADKHSIDSIGFCAISTGVFGYPIEEAAEVSLETVIDAAARLKNVKLIRFVLYSDKDLSVYEQALSRLIPK